MNFTESCESEVSLRKIEGEVKQENHKENQAQNSSIRNKKNKFKIRRRKASNKILKMYKTIANLDEKSQKPLISLKSQKTELMDSKREEKSLVLNYKIKARAKEQLNNLDKQNEQLWNKTTLSSHLQIEKELNKTKRNDKLKFEEEFEQIVLLKKEKLIKLKRCVGVESLDSDQKVCIQERRERLKEKEVLRAREECINRTVKENDTGLPVYHQRILNKQLIWEEETKDFFDQKNRLIKKFRENVTKIVIRIRAQKRLI
jgi:hypothetical protein